MSSEGFCASFTRCRCEGRDPNQSQGTRHRSRESEEVDWGCDGRDDHRSRRRRDRRCHRLSELHKIVLANPDVISKQVLAKRLDAETAFEIVSIDIADINVGENIGARLQADRAEADMRVARARAEGRRAEAVAAEQEMIARIQESRAVVVQAEAEVPKAIANAFRSGKLSIMDYYKLKNVDADSEMRRAIAGSNATVSNTLR